MPGPDTSQPPLSEILPARFGAGWLAGADTAGTTPTQAVALAKRLLAVEDRTLALHGRIARLTRELAEARTGGTGGGGWFDVPRTPFPWPLADDAARSEPELDKYDRRVDDPVVVEGRRGQNFLASFGLLGPTPRFEAAARALAAGPHALRTRLPGEDAPDVSIIIPIYGQLAYTLNCLDSLLQHETRFTAEIIVVDDCSPDRSAEVLPLVSRVRVLQQARNCGFIASCNDGARQARGRFVVMLNNDTRVVVGWLDAMIGSFDAFPAAGLVGSKMLYADGSLQEAGGIIWRQGNCWNYGRNDDPNRPQYSYARQVDYISGCSIALPMALWRELDGFDPYFSPAYCEDADLALRVVASGRQVWFQPQSRIIHYEGKTSGTDTGKGVKAYQVVNMRKLYARWRERLERHRPDGEAPFFERERSVHRRILVVDVTAPTPREDAGSVQTVLGLQVCRNAGYKTTFVAGENWLFQPRHTTDLQMAGIECAYAPYDIGFPAYIARFGHLFDVVMVYRVDVLQKFIGDIRAYAPQAALLFHVADLHFLRKQREAEMAGSAEGLAQAEMIRKRELALVAAADCTITHSQVEHDILAREVPGAAAVVWPMMLDFLGTKVGFAPRSDVCFLGGYRHPPNIDAVSYFTESILPLLHAEEPGLRFLIAGSNPNQEVLALQGGQVEVLGMVEDLRDLFDRARVFVCPLRYGAGVKGKVMSALSYGIPVVSTPIGIEGAGLTPEKDVLLAEDAAEFARQTLRAYRDAVLWQSLSENGMSRLREHHSVANSQAFLEEAITRAHRHRLELDEDGLSYDGRVR
jgi:GT2 family glycosyltransferase/glycosyltransferase involved in cell wall biosynthesis